MNKAYREEKAAIELDVAIQTLRNWRCQRKGPTYIKLGRCVRYLREDLDKFKRENRIDPRK
jgi:hypothetical protein